MFRNIGIDLGILEDVWDTGKVQDCQPMVNETFCLFFLFLLEVSVFLMSLSL
jgi:hypothetical protein